VIRDHRKVNVLCRGLLQLSICTLLISTVAPATDTDTAPNGPIPATLFGLHMHKPMILRNQPWPTVPFGAGRLWDTGTYWAEINIADGKYDWDLLDKWLARFHEHDIDDLLYTFGRAPQWASSRPNDSDCALAGSAKPMGDCDPPNDLKPDGTGPNQHWKDFVTAIATHSKNSRTSHIRYWEIYNEPNQEKQWKGTNAQMIRMAKDAREIILGIDPHAVIVTPPGSVKFYQSWMENYLHDGGGKNEDVMAVHAYVHTGKPGVYPVAADIIPGLKSLRKMMEDRGLASMPLFDTESSWGRARVMGFENDDDFQAGFLAQFYLLHWSQGISRLYWYCWNNGEIGTLWSPDPDNPSAPGRVHKAAGAYEQTYHWMVGATMNPLCSQAGDGIWTCGLTRPGGYEALAVWSTSGNKSYTANAKFKKFRDLDGNTTTITGGKVNIGFKPILLQNQ
jgi:polysaccharide biosynthesis protein PslG